MKKIFVFLFMYFSYSVCFAAQLDRVAVWERPDGNVSITYFDSRDMKEGESEDAFIERMKQKHGKIKKLAGATSTIVSKSKITNKREQRDFWSFKNGQVGVDQIKVQKEQNRQSEKQSILTKMNVTEEELKKALR